VRAVISAAARRTPTVVDPPRAPSTVVDLPRRPSTVVDLPRIPQDGGRSDDISSACRVGASTTVWRAVLTMAYPPRCRHPA